MAQHIGDGFLGNTKGRHRYFFRDAGQSLMAFQAPVHRSVAQRLEQMRPQAGFQPKAGQLPGVKDGRYIANLGQGFLERVAQHRALRLEVFGHPALEPVTLEFCRRQQLADVVVQLPTEAVAFVFLDLQQPIGQLLGLELDRLA
ncbi:hypothetical protein D3C76_1410880 [compost metagenome]